MQTIKISAEKRDKSGKQISQQLRHDGKMPAIIYGGKSEDKISMNSRELYKALSGQDGRRVVLNIGLGGEERHTLLQELQYHPITDKLIHADFLEIDITKPLQAKRPVVLEGEAVGVKLHGGAMKFHVRDLKLEATPDKMPVEIPVGVRELNINDVITLADVAVPEGVTKLQDGAMKVVSVAQPKRGPGGDDADEAAPEAAAEAKPEEAKEEEKK